MVQFLLQKLSSDGVEVTARAWFTSFLTNRSDHLYEIAPVSIGVAQGSIIGPLFIIYMNNLPDVLQFCQVSLYADDTVLCLASKSAAD